MLQETRGISASCCDTFEEMKCKSYNNSPGELTDYDCKECKNRGNFMEYKNGYEFMRGCRCMEIRRNIRRMKKSGLTNVMKRYTFDNFEANENWQKSILESAKKYVNSNDGQWFYIGGQVGSGKTHICTAILLEFLNKGMMAKYMLWRDEIVRIKANVNDDEGYTRTVNPLKTAQVLYIDDFFKTEKGKTPTTAEINIAFEILNYRYNNKGLITIISAEYAMDKLIDIDEAVGSRIYQRTKEYCINIAPDMKKNYRLV